MADDGCVSQPKHVLLALPVNHPRGQLAGLYIRDENSSNEVEQAEGLVWLRAGGGGFLSKVNLPANGLWTFAQLEDFTSKSCGIITSNGHEGERRPQDVDFWRFDDGPDWIYDKHIVVTTKPSLLNLQLQLLGWDAGHSRRSLSQGDAGRASDELQERGGQGSAREVAEVAAQCSALEVAEVATQTSRGLLDSPETVLGSTLAELEHTREKVRSLEEAQRNVSEVGTQTSRGMLDSPETVLGSTLAELEQTREKLRALEDEKEGLVGAVAQASLELEQTRQRLEDAERGLREAPSSPPVDSLLGSVGIEDAISEMRTLRATVDGAREKLDALGAEKAELEAAMEALQQENQRLRAEGEASVAALALGRHAGPEEGSAEPQSGPAHEEAARRLEVPDIPEADGEAASSTTETSEEEEPDAAARLEELEAENRLLRNEKATRMAMEAEFVQARLALVKERREMQALSAKIQAAAGAMSTDVMLEVM